MDTSRASRLRRLGTVIFAVVGVGVVGLMLMRSRTAVETATPAPEGPKDEVRLDAAAQRDAGIAVDSVRSLSRAAQIEAPGLLALDETRTARLGSIVEGTVVRVNAEVGDRVQSGQVLAELHGPVVHESWAAYRKAAAEKRRAQIERDYAVQAYERARRLYADKAISLQETQRALADRRAAEEALDVAATEQRRAEETLEHFGITSGEDPSGETGASVQLRTPISGAVLEREITAGSAVTPGAPLFVVSDLSSLWASAEVEETQLSRLRVGAPVKLRVAAYPDESFTGTIIFIGDTLDPTTRRVRVRCQVPNADGRLKSQMFANIAVGETTPTAVTAAPTSSVQEMDGKAVVFVAKDDGTFARREVVTGRDVEGWTEIVSGVQPGERVATTGSFLLKSKLLQAGRPAEE